MNLIVSPAGFARWGRARFRCALGWGGVTRAKREGDGATPVGTWRMRGLHFRSDRVLRPRTGLPARPITPEDGWCDDPADARYNQPVRHPYPRSAERLWREDALYDLVIPLGYNDAPPAPGRGSAIFLHVARRGYGPTAGCVALARRDLLAVLRKADRFSRVIVLPGYFNDRTGIFRQRSRPTV
jgi:L,D-peptidoglycan transpeptidase YkuD (ErfK/YbiS/YcfS/YnhG family)